MIFFIPFIEEQGKTKKISWGEFQNTKLENLDKYGVYFNLTKIHSLHSRTYRHAKENQFITGTNQGLLISNPNLPAEIERNRYFLPRIFINYPSSFIQLDVARETVLAFKKDIDFSEIPKLLNLQILEYFLDFAPKKVGTSILNANAINFYLKHDLKIAYDSRLDLETFTIQINSTTNGFDFYIIKLKDIPREYNKENTFFLSYSDKKFVKKFEDFFIGKNWIFDIIKIAKRIKSSPKKIQNEFLKIYKLKLSGNYNDAELRFKRLDKNKNWDKKDIFRLTTILEESLEISQKQRHSFKEILEDSIGSFSREEQEIFSFIDKLFRRVSIQKLNTHQIHEKHLLMEEKEFPTHDLEVLEFINEMNYNEISAKLKNKELFKFIFKRAVLYSIAKGRGVEFSLLYPMILIRSVIFSKISTVEYKDFKFSINFLNLFNKPVRGEDIKIDWEESLI